MALQYSVFCRTAGFRPRSIKVYSGASSVGRRNISLAGYLFTRLKQNNVDALHGVPGDFTLKALDHVAPAGLRWIGGCNELNAGYAADGYARVRGLGAVLTTYGVGELSVTNAVAGSFAEHVPVVHIVGTPTRRLQQMKANHLHIHHTLGDGRLPVFSEIAQRVTVAQARLHDETKAAEMVDWVIGEAKRWSRPVYIELPSDMVSVEVDEERLKQPIVPKVEIDHASLDKAEALLQRLYAAERPLILVDRGMGLQNLRPKVNKFVESSGIPTLALPSGAGMVDNSLDNYFGVHSGPIGAVDTMQYTDAADLILTFGPMFSDTQTLGWKTVPELDKMVIIGKNSIDDSPTDTSSILDALVEKVDPKKISQWATPKAGGLNVLEGKRDSLHEKINQTEVYHWLNRCLKPHDVVLLGNATPVIGGRDFVIPHDAHFIASGMWFSIGHMLPAAQGAALAQGEKGRAILFDGDGNIQMTVQEISTMIRERLNVTIFVFNNGGYAYERLIHGLDESYNDLAPWKYLEAAKFFGAPEDYPVETHRIETWSDLSTLLNSTTFNDGQGLKLVELVLGRDDVPEKVRPVFQRAGENL